jgi:hypothetical protein
MADKDHNPVEGVVEVGETAHTAHHIAETVGEARAAYTAGGGLTAEGLAAGGRVAAVGAAETAFWAVAGQVALHASGIFATAEDKVPYGHGEGVPNHSTSVPASDPGDPHKVPNDDAQASHGAPMSHAPEVSTPNPQMSQEPQASHNPQQSEDPQQSGGHQSDPQLSSGHQDPQMSHAPDVSTHNPDAAPDPGYHQH